MEYRHSVNAGGAVREELDIKFIKDRSDIRTTPQICVDCGGNRGSGRLPSSYAEEHTCRREIAGMDQQLL